MSQPLYQDYRGIRLKLIDRSYGQRKARRFTLNDTNQNVWIPNKHLDESGLIKPGENVDYVFRSSPHQLELAGYTDAIPGIKKRSASHKG